MLFDFRRYSLLVQFLGMYTKSLTIRMSKSWWTLILCGFFKIGPNSKYVIRFNQLYNNGICLIACILP